ncbi:RNA polymerase sigma-70 factor (ECF subfamily) [Pullulanibacillus pueri]|uniref:RNA polymerase sigma factor n=1 Tax=Pullulanibacillus pueri TaxID=1437324 RepID=A0A8J2ZZR6_9BACL|nr:RNA polymerase sigma factor SigW [Pullulanibacillus pueri]MBM7684201.1 RNA polymerase sigma-70 factor (ECF subfamily) [Pullulanibacillus pueri]GGH88943.1 ECF RNA polymerase sigma factor SigW [Pullulanibacillus pueri]
MSDKVKQLILRVRKGDHDAFAKIVEFYKKPVYNICLRMVGIPQEAEDLAQDAFLRAYTNIDRYELDKKFSTWLYRIATNLSIDYLRRKKPAAYLDSEVPGTDGFTMYSQFSIDEPLPEERVVDQETKEWVQYEINQLPPKYRSAIILKYIEDLSLKEISEILDLPVPTVKTRIHRGREALRKRMKRSKKR